MPEIQEAISPVQLLAVGRFGRVVGGYLSRLRKDVIETIMDNDALPLPEAWPNARVTVLAAWRPVPSLCEQLDDRCHRLTRPFVPLIVDSTVLRLGPIAVPGREGCWGCWNRRSQQHCDWTEERSAILQHYATHPDSGPQGFLETFAMMGAARISQTIEGLDSSSAASGRVWQIDMLTRRITEGSVIGIHGCPRCGEGRAESSRSYADLRESLAYLWKQRREIVNRTK